MKDLHAKDPKRYEVQFLCELFGVSKQAYYKHNESKVLARAAREAFALEYIKDIRTKDPGMGGDKIWHMYRRDFKGNDPIGRDWFGDIINKHNLKVRLKVRKPRTTDSTHGLPIYTNLVKDFIPTGPTNYGSAISRISSSGWMPVIISFATCRSYWMPTPRKSSVGVWDQRWKPCTHWRP